MTSSMSFQMSNFGHGKTQENPCKKKNETYVEKTIGSKSTRVTTSVIISIYLSAVIMMSY